jgi:superfamily I DNA/RNA helicase
MRGARLVKATLTATRPDLLSLIDEHDLKPSFVEDPNEVAGYIADTVRGCLSAWPLTDFDDEVWLPVYWGIGLASFDYVFIDEAQDLTLTQIRLALSAAGENGRIIAIGDPAQAIYRWRGADRDPFARLKTELKAVEFPLSVSYRCPRAVVRLAQASVPDIQAHPDAPEGRVDDIQLGEMLTTVRPGDFVLSRTNAPLAQLGLDLANNNVPMRVLGSADIGTVLANLVKRSKKKTVETFLVWLDNYAEKEGTRLKDKPSALDYLDDKVETIRSFAAGETDTIKLVAKIERFYEEQRTDKRTVILSTVHRLKGDEANRVFVLEETFWSKRGDPEEEDHIWYVAITRAKQHLFRVTGLYRKKKDEDE